MSAGCLRWMLSQTVRAACGGGSGYWTPASRFTISSDRSNIAASSWRWSPFSTTVEEDTDQTPAPKKKKNPHGGATVGSVGRKIPEQHIQVISEAGENLGTMHRADVIRIMDEKGLKLVLLNQNKDPPVYKLMSGKQIHEEQLRLREKQKAKAGVWCPHRGLYHNLVQYSGSQPGVRHSCLYCRFVTMINCLYSLCSPCASERAHLFIGHRTS